MPEMIVRTGLSATPGVWYLSREDVESILDDERPVGSSAKGGKRMAISERLRLVSARYPSNSTRSTKPSPTRRRGRIAVSVAPCSVGRLSRDTAAQ
jgi:hypothetical protein